MATNTEKLDEIFKTVTQLSTEFKSSCDQVKAMYKILVTGNGQPPLPEVVREHEKWIADQEKETEKREDTRLKIKLMGLGQILTLVGLAVAVWLGLK
jgi:hypothetical protein